MMESSSQCGSPAGMGQLIKYFESQSRRLDRQAVVCPSSLNPDFQSSIKFSGVPILPPAITSSRRDELRQLKKDAVLLEKRLRARHRKDLLDKADYLVGQSRGYYRDTSSRQAARQLNFDSGEPEQSSRLIRSPDKPEGSNSCSNFALTDTSSEQEEFGLQTMDSVNSDFMSLNSDSIPRVFSGLTLTSVKEQKISYDLDRLSKALNVQDLESTSGSDLSETIDFSHTQCTNDPHSTKNIEDFQNSEDQNSPQKVTNERDVHSKSSSSSNIQGTDARPFLDPGKITPVGNSDTAEFVENTKLKNIEHPQSNFNSVLGLATTNASTATTEGQWSNRSSPKSLRSGVHFASFVTEYINTSASQSFECPTVVKKKMSAGPSKEDHDVDTIFPVLGDLSKWNRRNLLPRKATACENISCLLENVALCLDSDLTPANSSLIKVDCLPFQDQGRCETYSSDKENDVSQLYKNVPQQHKRSVELTSTKSNADQSTQSYSCERQQKTNGDEINISSKRTTVDYRDPSLTHIKNLSPTVSRSVLPVAKIVQDLSSLSVSSSIVSNQTSLATDPTQTLFLEPALGKTASKSDSLDSSKSNTLTNTSESSIGTIKDELPKDKPNASMNIVDATFNCDCKGTDEKSEKGNTKESPMKVKENHEFSSPKKLNIEGSIQEPKYQDKSVTPNGNNICRNSYTLSEPSPALVQAQGRQDADKREQRRTMNVESTMLHVKQSNVGGSVESPMKVQSDPVKSKVDSDLPTKGGMLSDAEVEGKAEHINKYLNEVQFQNSINLTGQGWEAHQLSAEYAVDDEQGSDKDVDSISEETVPDECPISVVDVLKSISESHGSLEQLTVDELLDLHQQQMNDKRQALIRQQQRDMEELFVQQRREVMLLEGEIKAAQQMEKEQQKFLLQNAPENIKVKSRHHDGEYSPKSRHHDGEYSPKSRHHDGEYNPKSRHHDGEYNPKSRHHDGEYSPKSRNHDGEYNPKSRNHDGEYSPVQTRSFEKADVKHWQPEPVADNSRFLSDTSLPQSSHQLPSSNHTLATSKKLEHKSYPGMEAKSDKCEPTKPKLQIMSRNTSMMTSSPDSMNDDNQTSLKSVYGRHVYSRAGAGTDAMGITNVIAEFSPSTASPRLHRVVMRSPVKYTPLHRRSETVVVPPEAYLPMMEVKFNKLTATAKGFLTRLLLKSDKVQELVKTIRDTREFAFSFQTETPIKKGNFTVQDKVLLERIIAQLQAALLDIHEIFFEIPISERLGLIEQTRLSDQEKRAKAASKDNMRESGPKISQATLKALERKRKSRDVEMSIRKSSSRPKTAPARISSTFLSKHTDNRTLRPLQGPSQITARLDTNRPEKVHPDTAKEKSLLTQPKRIVAVPNKFASILVKDNNDFHKKGSIKLSITTNKTVMKLKPVTSKPSTQPPSQPMKSWR